DFCPSLVYCSSVANGAKPDYGIDAPGVIRNLFIAAALLLILGPTFPVIHVGPVTILWRSGAIVTGTFCLIEGVLMIVYARRGKLQHRDRMLNMVKWRGDEQVLDVGTGRGLLAIGAAKKLTTGRATGIDIWSSKDLSGNALEQTMRNVELEGVRGRVDIQS